LSATEVIEPRWSGLVIVAAPGPSLTPAVAEACKGQRVVAVGEAWQAVPWAEALYHCDAKWWDVHRGAPEFQGERWSLHCSRSHKIDAANKYGLRLVASKAENGFSLNPSFIHEGRNSGFQATNLAILMGGNPIVLVGFDMHGASHFCKRPAGLKITRDYAQFALVFDEAAKLLPPGIEIWNATPGSRISGFKRVKLEDVLLRFAA
jgi:hypothetical protein